MKYFKTTWLNKKNFLKILALAIAVIITFIIFLFKDKLSSLTHYGYVGIFLLSVLGNATIILPMPVILTAFVGGGLFNPIIVGLIAAFGATIGELTGYLAGFGGSTLIEKNKIFIQIEKWMQKYGLLTVFILAIIPNPFFDIAGIIAGAMHLPLPLFFLVTFLGKAIKFLIISHLGSGSANFVQGVTTN